MNDATILSELGAAARRGVSVAELHGAACGVAITSGLANPAFLLVELLGPDALADMDAVDAFVQHAIAALYSDELGFEPLLLDVADGVVDQDDFTEETAQGFVEGLAQWSAAFVAGLFAGAPDPDDDEGGGERLTSHELAGGAWDSRVDLGPDAEELIQDLLAIARLDTNTEGADLDEQENAFTELREFVRVAALLLAANAESAGTDRNDDRQDS